MLSTGEVMKYGVCVWSAGNAPRPLVQQLAAQIPEQVRLEGVPDWTRVWCYCWLVYILVYWQAGGYAAQSSWPGGRCKALLCTLPCRGLVPGLCKLVCFQLYGSTLY